MTTALLQNKRKVVLHIAFWCVYASFFLYQISTGRRGSELGWDLILTDFSFHIASMMGISYLNYFFFMPRLLQHRNLGRYLLEFIPLFIGLMYLVLLGKQYINDGFTHKEQWLYSFRFGLNVYVSSLFLVIFVSLLKFVEDYFDYEDKRKALENEKLISELRFLKAQINPHFLFNTLNNLYYLAFTQSPHTPEVIAKLSQMMRYMLYDSNHERVPIDKELEYMQNYISLEQLRLNQKVPIKYTVEGNTEGVRIAPLVFITFLENAFKHGVSNAHSNSWVDISLRIEDEICTYKVVNSKIPEEGKTVTEKSGIGLQNVRRRLELSYADHFDLEIKDEPDQYSVELKLQLS